MSAVNLLENGDFECIKNAIPDGWQGFENSQIYVPATEKFNGKNCCATRNRTKHSYGPCQNVLHSVQLGCQYEFNAYVKLDPDQPEFSTKKIRVQLQLKLTNMAKGRNTWIRVASVDATPNEWTQITGTLDMPRVDAGNLISAILYFGGPPQDVNFMVADVELFKQEWGDCRTDNLLRNPDFNDLTNSHPKFWYGFGDAKIYIHPVEKFDGNNVCVSHERKERYGGLGQYVHSFVSLADENSLRKYEFSANIRLHPDIQATEKHNISVKLQYQLATEEFFHFAHIATAFGVTSKEWVQINGRLVMPPAIPGNQLITAILYFGNVPTEVNFMVAKTRLSKLDPPAPKDFTVNLSKESSDVTTGAPVFISYQWDIQEKVKKLKDKLEKCGISCWMDIGQMGGGEALYAEIDKGMRTAKVIISCVTRKYAESENCQREVKLADGLKKPIIPVLFDNELQWPPPGQMSLIFAKLRYINVCEDEKGEIPPTKFQELLSEVKKRIDI